MAKSHAKKKPTKARLDPALTVPLLKANWNTLISCIIKELDISHSHIPRTTISVIHLTIKNIHMVDQARSDMRSLVE